MLYTTAMDLEHLLSKYKQRFKVKEIPLQTVVDPAAALPSEVRESVLRQLDGWLSSVRLGQSVKVDIIAIPGGCEIEMRTLLPVEKDEKTTRLPYMEIHQTIDPAGPVMLRKIVAKIP